MFKTLAVVCVGIVQVRVIAVGLVTGYVDVLLLSPLVTFLVVFLLTKIHTKALRVVLSLPLLASGFVTLLYLNEANVYDNVFSLLFTMLVVFVCNMLVPHEAFKYH